MAAQTPEMATGIVVQTHKGGRRKEGTCVGRRDDQRDARDSPLADKGDEGELRGMERSRIPACQKWKAPKVRDGPDRWGPPISGNVRGRWERAGGRGKAG